MRIHMVLFFPKQLLHFYWELMIVSVMLSLTNGQNVTLKFMQSGVYKMESL